jgi:hypothetical protein
MNEHRKLDIEFFAMAGCILCVRYDWLGIQQPPIIYMQEMSGPYLPGLSQEEQESWTTAQKEAGW